MALSQGLIDTAWRRYNSRRALTGLPSSYQEMRGTFDPIMEATANKDIQEAQLRYQNERSNRQLSLQEQAQKDAARAATVSGVASLGQLGASSYLGYKYLTKPPSALENALTAYYGGGGAAPVTGADITAAGGMFNAPSYTAPALTTPGYTPPALSGAGSGGSGVLAGAGSGATVAGSGSAAFTGATGTAAYGSAEGSGVAGVLGAEGGTGILGTVAAPVAGWGLGNLAAMAIDKYSPIGGAKEKSIAGNIAKGAGIGAGIGSVVPGIGTVIGGAIGGAIGGVVGLVEDASVICSELLRQGGITEKDRTSCVVFRFRRIPDPMFMAYLEWAAPIVAIMRREGIGNKIIRPFATAFVGYMISVQRHRKITRFQRIVWKYAWRRCEKIVQRNEQFVGEVA